MHLYFAKQKPNKAILIGENQYQCCNFENETEKNYTKIILKVLIELTHEHGKIDIKSVKVLLTYKLQMIIELRKRINILTKHVEFLSTKSHEEVRITYIEVNKLLNIQNIKITLPQVGNIVY